MAMTMMRKIKCSCLLTLLLCLLCVARGVYARLDERHAFARLLQTQLTQPNEESVNLLEMKVAEKEEEDLEYDDEEYDEMINQQLEILKAQQEQKKQWCLSNKHFKESQWFSEALENASKCITWEKITLLGKTKERFKIFLLKESSQINEKEGKQLNNRQGKTDSEWNRKGKEDENDNENSKEQSDKINKLAQNEEENEEQGQEKTARKEEIEELEQQDKQQETKASESNKLQTTIKNNLEGEISADATSSHSTQKEKEFKQSSKKLQLQKIQQEVREESLIWQSAKGELIQPKDSSDLSSQSTCISKQGNNYCNQEKCLQTEMKESIMKEDFLRLLRCLNEGILEQASSNSSSKTPKNIFQHCLVNNSSFFPNNQNNLVKKVQFQVEHCSRIQNLSIFKCLNAIQNEDESRLVRKAFECATKYTSSHDSILPFCQKQFLAHFDAQHEEFQELCDLKCGKLYEKFFAPLVLESSMVNYNELRTCIKSITVENGSLKIQAINVITCFKEKQMALQEKWTRN